MKRHGEMCWDPTSLQFKVFSTEDIKQMSVAKIVTSLLFDAVGRPLPGGLYDPILGACRNGEFCRTCNKPFTTCPGHMGYIELCMTTYNPLFASTVLNIMKISCLKCFKIQVTDDKKELLDLQLTLLNNGYIIEAQEIETLKLISNVGDDVRTQLDKYKELLQREPVNVLCSSKNIQSMRASIISTSIKECIMKKCIHCNLPMVKVKRTYRKMVISMNQFDVKSFYEKRIGTPGETPVIKATNRPLFADQCRLFLREIYANDGQFLEKLFPMIKDAPKNMKCATDIFFIDCIPIPPPNQRPVATLQSGVITVNMQTQLYQDIMDKNSVLRSVLCVLKNELESQTNVELKNEYKKTYDSMQGDTPEEKMNNAWNALQEKVDNTLDASHDRHARGRGLKQIIEQKDGLIRKHMMGKRVNYAARTVITPDPNIGVDEIGVPEEFALKLNYPVPVTTWNVVQLRQMVINGPNKHPGACSIKDESGKIKNLKFSNENDRISCAKTLLTKTGYQNFGVKIVHRHLLNNDVLLMNRQPTLHRPSIQAHRVRILKNEKTFRMHYSNCKAYNADFDGDEMNAHFPQNELARSEAYNLVAVPHQYLVPKDGTPLGGLIQDQVISGVKLMIRGKFFNRDDYNQLVFQAMSNKSGTIRLLPPTVWKPRVMWSGKQVISTIIINSTPAGVEAINLEGTSKIRANAWNTIPKKAGFKAEEVFSNENSMTEAEIVIRKGELVSGILDKNHYGSVAYGLVHCMYELYGGQVSSDFLTSLTRLFTYYLQWEGFTLGVHDILVQDQANKKRSKIIKESRKAGHEAACNALGLPPAETARDELSAKLQAAHNTVPNFRAILDREYKRAMDKYTNDINKVCLPSGLICKFPDNNLQLMVQSGAKGSTVNTMQISCLLGQIELEGKRPPQMISGRSLPSFPTFETSPKSGGFIDGRFMTGIQPQDFFFHCMAGREGLIDTAVKTSRSGYLQRCLIKHLEGLTVNYDLTVRDSDNSVIQFLYGEDGMDICKTQFLKEPQLQFLDANHGSIVTPNILEKLENDPATNDAIQAYKKKLKSWTKRKGKKMKKPLSAFQRFANATQDQVTVSHPGKLRKNTGRTKLTQKLVHMWMQSDGDQKAEYDEKAAKQKGIDPVISHFQSDNCYGAISEYLEQLIEQYAKVHPERRTEIQDIIYVKGMRALAEPGEPVGLLAAQSIGEPSTQMTLNTFHFAGRGEMNVTLGIPRLREILMLASPNIKTPSMDIPFLKQLQPGKDEDMNDITERVRIKMNRTTVADVLESIDVKSKLILTPNRATQYNVLFRFLPPSNYESNFCVTSKQILKHMNKVFFAQMFRAIQLATSTKNKVVDVDEDEKKETRGKKKKEKERDDYMIDNQAKTDTTYGENCSSDEEPDENMNDQDDAGAGDDKLKGKQSDKHDYEDKEDEDSGVEDNSSDEENNRENSKLAARKQLEEGESTNETEEDREIEDALLRNSFIRDFKFDKKHSWCKLTFEFPTKMKKIDISPVLRAVALKSVIYEIPNIKRAITYKQNDEIILKTDGINIVEMFKYNQILDIRRLYSNDIHGIAKTYGIEAAARVIVKEVQNVFKVYGIVVDPRHLLLIADYMTFDGQFRSLSRIGMSSSASPLQQMSFETSLKFLCEATVMAKEESLSNPSGRLMVGQPCKGGTGSFQLISDNNYLFKKMLDAQ